MILKLSKLFLYFTLSFLTITTLSCRKDSKWKIRKNHQQAVGDSSNDLLSNNKYKKLIVEIQYMAGYRPTDDALDNLERFLINRLNKNEGIFLKVNEIPAQNKSSYSIDDIKEIESQNRREFTHKKEIATYFLFLDGEYSGNTSSNKVLGVAYYNTSMAIFEKTVRDLSGGITEPPQYKLETTILNHEFGHILGLVNVGTPMQTEHQDEVNGHHCDEENCLMNWVAETGDVVNNLTGSAPIPTLDQNCINDLRANGGR